MEAKKEDNPHNLQGKELAVYRYMVEHGSINRFEAVQVGDWCLNSTISVLRNRKGIKIVDKYEKVPTKWGRDTTAKRYKLSI